MMQKIFKWLKKNALIITSVGGLIFIINQVGFSLNISSYYGSLTPEGKILFIGSVNFILTIILFSYSLNKKENKAILKSKK